MMKFDKKKLQTDLIIARNVTCGFSIEQAASEIGINKSTLYRIERGSDMCIETFVKCLNWLRKQPSEYINSKL